MKETKKLRTLLAFIAMFAMIGSYFVSPNLAKVEAASKKLKVIAPKTVAVNQTITLTTNVKAKFKSSNKKVATVSSKGVVKGKKAGKVTITVTSKSNKKQKKTVKITVKNQLVITAPDGAKATLQVGETTKIKTNLSSTYVSSAASIADVSSNGTVTAKAEGTATITVTSKKYKKLKKTVAITVTKPEEVTTEATTEATTTQQPKSDVKPGDKPTTETPTAQQPSSETPKSEEPTSEEPTSEEPTSEEPTSEEPTLVGVEAEYRGSRVPNDIYKIGIQGVILKEVYSDGSKKIVPITYDVDTNMIFDFSRYQTIDGKNYGIWDVEYEGFSTEMKVEMVDVGDTVFSQGMYCEYTGPKLKEGEYISSDDLSATIVNTDKSEYILDDNTKLNILLFEDLAKTEGVKKYWFIVTYDYIFEDAEGNELYVNVQGSVYVPYE